MLSIAAATALGSLVHKYKPTHSRKHHGPSGWRRRLSEALESRLVLLAVVLLLITDLCCLILGSLGEWVEEELVEGAERVGFCCLVAFLTEQVLHFVADGEHFFSSPWHVVDTCVVSISLATELNSPRADEYRLVLLMRVWKVFVVCFDAALLRHEEKSLAEKGVDIRSVSPTAVVRVLSRSDLKGLKSL